MLDASQVAYAAGSSLMPGTAYTAGILPPFQANLNYAWSLSNGLPAASGSSSATSFSFTTGTDASAPVVLACTATDGAGNTSSSTITFQLGTGTQKPTILSFTGPANGSTPGGGSP